MLEYLKCGDDIKGIWWKSIPPQSIGDNWNVRCCVCIYRRSNQWFYAITIPSNLGCSAEKYTAETANIQQIPTVPSYSIDLLQSVTGIN